MSMHNYSKQELAEREDQLRKQYEAYRALDLDLDLTRGKPSREQLDLSVGLDERLDGAYLLENGTDVRNYGGLLGIPEAREFGARMLGLRPEEVLVGGNSSLTLMYQYIGLAHLHGLAGPGSSWCDEARASQGKVKFLCPVPGYDRHFTICEHFDIEMINTPLETEGPDMNAVEALVAADPLVKGIWCVPRYSNPTGQTYSDNVVQRLAGLARVAGEGFRIIWDNAYAVHHLTDHPPPLLNLMDECRALGTARVLVVTGSTSKITYAGAGISFLGSDPHNLERFSRYLSASTIGPDKLNQLRHTRFLTTSADLSAHMQRHREIIEPKFRRTFEILAEELAEKGILRWTEPAGGYFISCDTIPGLAALVVALAADIGVKLTPAGATFPYGRDPEDRNIRLAPTCPPMDELEQAVRVFACCVELASVQRLRAD
ncbi:MAG: aminotransferase class I/II-fold pyridoxal phosphate-dependent enzyme [Myxococcota bacterium]